MSAQDNLSKHQMEKIELPHKEETRYLSRTSSGGGVSSTLVHPYTRFYTFHSTDEHGTPTLFDHTHLPPKLDNLFAHGHSAADVSAHLGTVALESLHRFGQLPDTSDERLSLSESSAPLVSKINKKLKRPSVSIDPENHMNEQNAEHEIKGAKEAFDKRQNTKLDPQLVKSGSAFTRSLLSNKKPLSKKQFNNLELPL